MGYKVKTSININEEIEKELEAAGISIVMPIDDDKKDINVDKKKSNNKNKKVSTKK
ncbi:MAG TPA: hypothetical protein PKG93_04135 [Bacilli bacterium]|jgi:hypothetical protein|nr:hypothetical protein [Bacilli bacterium]HPZ23857.1 hypothetical protein [Bacilli bacterium]